MVALKSHQADGVLRSPDKAIVAALFHGADAGLVSERAQRLAETIARRDTPPAEILRIGETDLELDPDRLLVELQTRPMFGGGKVVRTQSGRRVTAQLLKPLIEEDRLDAFLIVEAGALKPDEAMRILFEKPAKTIAVACYADEGIDLERLIADVLSARKIGIAPSAKTLLLSRLGADRALSRMEIEKLALFAHGKSSIEDADVDAIVGDASELAVDGILQAVAGGRRAVALAAFDSALAGGENAQMIIAALTRYMQRLHRVTSAMAAGRPVDEAMRQLRPPLHFKQQKPFLEHCRLWRAGDVARALRLINTALKAARLGGQIDAALAERLLIDVAGIAAARSAQARGR